MTFDKSKVYTSLNAEELEVGSEVIAANCLELLQAEVKSNSWPTYVKKLDEVLGPDHIHRFKLPDSRAYNLAYLVRKVDEAKLEDEKWIAYLAREENGKCCLTACNEDRWEDAQKSRNAKTKLFVGTYGEAIKWYESRQKFTEVIKSWEDGNVVQVRRSSNRHIGWIDTPNPNWDVSLEYRVKPEEDLYVAYVDHYEPHLDFGLYTQWDRIQEYRGAKNKLFVGSEEECKEWCDKREKFADVILAWENEKKVQFYSVAGSRNIWVTVNNPSWDAELEYRVKPDGLVWTDLKIGNILWKKDEKSIPLGGRDEYVYVEERRMVTVIVKDPTTNRHIQLGGDWIADENLKEWSIAE